MIRRPNSSIVANPILVGAITALVVVTAVFLAYNANKGLPFVPSHALRVQLPNGANLAPGNDVREGGQRIGFVEAMRPVQLPGGQVGAEAQLKIDEVAWSFPSDTTVAVRGRSVLGLKYLDIRRGDAERELPENGLVAASDAVLSHDLDRFLGMYDASTRDGARLGLKGFGGAFAGRGPALNRTLEAAPAMLGRLEAVMDLLGRPQTGLARFITELGDAARVVRPVAGRYAHSFAAGADTFAALSASPRDLDTTIREIPETLRVGTRSFRAQRPLLREVDRLSAALLETAGRLPKAIPALTSLAVNGTPALADGTRLNRDTEPVLARLRELSDAPASGTALRALNSTNAVLNPLLRFAGPYITVCNYFNIAVTHASDTGSEPDLTGTTARTMLIVAPRQDNSPGSIGASEPANGQNVLSGNPAFLHQNVYSAAVDRQGNADCESGQRGYLERVNTFGDKKYKTVVDPHIPGNQGPTFSGRARVPAGQTFSRAPELGPRMPKELDP